jgi:hypothetical protein
MLAGRAIDLHAGIPGVTGDMLAAVRAGEFEIGHKILPQNVPASEFGDKPSNRFFRTFASAMRNHLLNAIILIAKKFPKLKVVAFAT